MIKRLIHPTILLAIAFCLSAGIARAQTESRDRQPGNRTAVATGGARLVDRLAQARLNRRQTFSLVSAERRVSPNAPAFFTPMASGAGLPVLGSGTVGRLARWTGLTSSNSMVGDSSLFEDKYGNIGIGTDSPTSKLTVAGMVQSSSGGFKFPDGTVQTTSAGAALFAVTHNATLTGNGTAASPLGVAMPLVLNGPGGITAMIEAINTTDSGHGVRAQGGNVGGLPPGAGVFAQGGNNFNTLYPGGPGVVGKGGSGTITNGGTGVNAIGGDSDGAGTVGGTGIYAQRGLGKNGGVDGKAGSFYGDVDIQGNLTKSGGSFKIDHPLDPANKYLYHSFVESPDMKNIYDGNVVTDANGEATVTLPAYFEALNRDFRYQLTVIGTFAQAIIADEIKGNCFVIRTSAPNVKVSWQVTGIRRDAWANKNRIPVEVEKEKLERGYFLHPELFNQPEERGVEWARHPEMMQQLKPRRTESEQKVMQGQQR